MHTIDVAVVGAGFAGLTAAAELVGYGLDVEVFEARDRVGGKTESHIDQLGHPIDTGGQFVSDDMPHVRRLIEQQGKHLVPVHHDRAGQGFGASWDVFDAAEQAYSRLWSIDGVASPHATLGEWFDSLDVAPEVVDAARATFGGVMCMPVDDIPLAHAVDLARRTPLTRDEMQYIVAETIHRVAVDLAEPLTVHLTTPVQAIESDDDDGVVVRSHHRVVRARHAVVAVPPSAYRTIAFDPPLPGFTAAAAHAFRPGSVIKFLARYARPFWRRPDIGATAMWLDPPGFYVGEASPDDETFVLVGFLGGAATARWWSMPSDARRAAFIDRLIEAYGPDAAHPVSFVERDWAPDDWGGGGYWNVLVDAGQPDAVNVLRGGAPGITFASTELSPAFPGYIEGAITAGLAAAERVQALLDLR
ncbi:MAG: FAD-dependent oxidoreductase [Actinobacteria bacterium]|nr:FAD-dependent oxidoreductase [Actinomycetota bacterium]